MFQGARAGLTLKKRRGRSEEEVEKEDISAPSNSIVQSHSF
jgi:hypothetical protein